MPWWYSFDNHSAPPWGACVPVAHQISAPLFPLHLERVREDKSTTYIPIIPAFSLNGEGMIGAGAVVTKSVPAHAVVMGNQV